MADEFDNILLPITDEQEELPDLLLVTALEALLSAIKNSQTDNLSAQNARIAFNYVCEQIATVDPTLSSEALRLKLPEN